MSLQNPTLPLLIDGSEIDRYVMVGDQTRTFTEEQFEDFCCDLYGCDAKDGQLLTEETFATYGMDSDVDTRPVAAPLSDVRLTDGEWVRFFETLNHL